MSGKEICRIQISYGLHQRKNIWYTVGKNIFLLSFIITAYSTLRHKERKGCREGGRTWYVLLWHFTATSPGTKKKSPRLGFRHYDSASASTVTCYVRSHCSTPIHKGSLSKELLGVATKGRLLELDSFMRDKLPQ